MAKGWAVDRDTGKSYRITPTLKKRKEETIMQRISSPNIFPTREEMTAMTCDQAILWAIESFDIAHLVQKHGYLYGNEMGKEDFINKFTESVFDMHEILGLKCGCVKKLT